MSIQPEGQLLDPSAANVLADYFLDLKYQKFGFC